MRTVVVVVVGGAEGGWVGESGAVGGVAVTVHEFDARAMVSCEQSVLLALPWETVSVSQPMSLVICKSELLDLIQGTRVCRCDLSASACASLSRNRGGQLRRIWSETRSNIDLYNLHSRHDIDCIYRILSQWPPE